MLDHEGLTTADVAAHARTLQVQFAKAVAAGRCGRLKEAGLLNPVQGDGPRARFLAFRHKDAQAWKARLQDVNVITDVRDDVLRFGFGLYQDENDVDRLIEVCRRVL